MARFIPATLKRTLSSTPHNIPHIEHATSIHGSTPENLLTYTNLMPSSCMPIHFFSVYETARGAEHLQEIQHELESTLIFHADETQPQTTLARAYSTLEHTDDQVASVYLSHHNLCVGHHNNAHVALWNVTRNTIASTLDAENNTEVPESFSLDDNEYVIILGSSQLWENISPRDAFSLVYEVLSSSGNVADAAEQLTEIVRTFGTAQSIAATVLWINPTLNEINTTRKYTPAHVH